MINKNIFIIIQGSLLNRMFITRAKITYEFNSVTHTLYDMPKKLYLDQVLISKNRVYNFNGIYFHWNEMMIEVVFNFIEMK